MSNREALPSGTVLDRRFRVEEILGSGGFGITYLAFDLGLQAPVAIKEYFPAQFATREVSLGISVRSHDRAIFERLRSSFLREARTLAQLDHPGIVRVYSVFETNGTAYMVMRFERGKSMKLWLEELGRPPTQDELDELLVTLLSALQHLHGLSFLHRDIAPDNIIIRPDMTPVLVDFGASRRLAGELTASVTGVVKEGYSPQEQYSVNAKAQGPWSDIYSLAATLYRAITGRKPDEATARMLADTTEPLVRSAGPGYRPKFLAAIDKAMSLHPVDRPQSVEEWGTALFDKAPAEPQSALSATVAAFPDRSATIPPHVEPPRARGRGSKVAAAAAVAALLIVPAAIAYRPAVIGDVAGLWQSVTQPKEVAESIAVSVLQTDPAARPEDAERIARALSEARIRAEEARERDAAEARSKMERERLEREAAARAREATDAAVRAKIVQEARELEAAAARAQLEREVREAAARAKAAQESRELEVAAARAQAEREAREAAARQWAEVERRRAIEAARVREAAEAAARAKAAQESRELEAAATRAQAARETREAAARQRAEANRRQEPQATADAVKTNQSSERGVVAALPKVERSGEAQKDAWCEENCRELCRLTVRQSIGPEACYLRIPCARFRGKSCAPKARVQARARTYCSRFNTCPVP